MELESLMWLSSDKISFFQSVGVFEMKLASFSVISIVKLILKIAPSAYNSFVNTHRNKGQENGTIFHDTTVCFHLLQSHQVFGAKSNLGVPGKHPYFPN